MNQSAVWRSVLKNMTRYPRDWRWPKGEKMAFTTNLALEAFRYRAFGIGGAKPGVADQFSLSYGEYGGRVGIYRLMDFMDEFGIKCSCSTNGRAAELYPEAVRALAQEGHELVGHGWENDIRPDASGVRDEIVQVTEAIERNSGQRPVGWVGPGSAGSAEVFQILAENGYVWNGDLGNDDLPYVMDTGKGLLVEMPRINLFHNDLATWLMSKGSPEIIWEMFRNTFDQLYREALRGAPKAIEITLHAHIAGRPTLIPTIRKCVEYARQHGDIWFPKKREVADWTLSLHEQAAKTG